MIKKLHINLGLLIVLDLCRLLYQSLLIICLESLIVQNANHVQKLTDATNAKKVIEGLIEKFPSVYQFWNGNLEKFVLLLRKGIYPHEYMDSWEKFDETTLPPKESFYSNLNLEDISDKDYAHVQKVWDVFEITNLGKYHELYVQSDTLLLEDVFENFRNISLDIYELDPVYFASAPGLAWQVCLKKIEVKLELLTDYDMILMIEKGIRGGICQATHIYVKASNKYMKNQDKNIESSYIEYLDVNNLYG